MNEEKIMILQMLKDSKITPEEAVKLMEALDEPGYEMFDDEMFQDEDKKNKFTNKTLEEVGSDISNAVGNLFNNLKSFGASIGINNLTENKEVDLEKYIGDLTNPMVDIKSVNGFIKLRKHDLDSIKINVYCRYKEGLISPNEEFYKFYIEGNRITFYPVYNHDISLTLDVQIPNKIYDEIILETTNDYIMIHEVDVNNLKCETKNGSIKLLKIKSHDVKLSTKNGRIEVEKLDSNNLEAITTNSRIVLEDINSTIINAHTANGKIKLTKNIADKIVAKTSNSSIDIDRLSAGLIDIKTSNSKIICNFFDIDKVKDLILSTSNGSIIANMNDINKNIYFDLETSIGNITVNYPNLVYETNKQANFGLKKLIAHSADYDENDDNIKFSAYTSNGSILIN